MSTIHYSFTLCSHFLSSTDTQFLSYLSRYISFLIASAACRDVSWQPCPNCDVNYFNSTFPPTNDRLAMNENNEIFIKKNNCNVTKLNSMVQYGTMIFIVVALFFLISYQSDKMVKFDEEQETTEDYAIEIKVCSGKDVFLPNHISF